jgi:hypothetical protein
MGIIIIIIIVKKQQVPPAGSRLPLDGDGEDSELQLAIRARGAA